MSINADLAGRQSKCMGDPMRIHVVGVCGTGMGSLAGLLAKQGHQVTGSDESYHPPIGPLLAKWGVGTQLGYAADRIAADLDLVIVGNVCRANNPEARRAFELGLPVTHIAGALQRFALAGNEPLVVAGTHGKTTTASLCAWLLDAAGLRPGFFIGGVPLNFGEGFRAAETPIGSAVHAPFVVEGDEYDTAFFEKTPKFLHYSAKHALLTSIEHDHIDIYPTEASYLAAFASLVAQMPRDGVLVANRDDSAVGSIVEANARCRVNWYSIRTASADWSIARHEQVGAAQHFDILHHGQTLGRAQLPLSGLHNVANALAATAAAVAAFGCLPETVIPALASFRGTKRRQELVAEISGIRVYDDFAHHPSAVRVTLEGLRKNCASGRLAAVFEARSATACRRLHQTAYATAFGAADLVLLAPLGRPEIAADERLDLAQLCSDLEQQGIRAEACDDRRTIVERLAAWAKPGDWVALLSNGTLAAIAPELVQALTPTASNPASQHRELAGL
jgi:UDP-N-acetylmuramate: L-alanyl-gamma-D-glutamyl-meso-diaminopimelate ligase